MKFSKPEDILELLERLGTSSMTLVRLVCGKVGENALFARRVCLFHQRVAFYLTLSHEMSVHVSEVLSAWSVTLIWSDLSRKRIIP